MINRILSYEQRHEIDGAAIAAALAGFMGWLPDLVVVATLIWLLIRIWESDTVRELTGRETNGNGKDGKHTH